MVVVRRTLVAASAIGLAACTAILGIDEDYQQGTTEAGIESGADVADSADEIALDAGFEGSPCEQMHTFCDDFDKNGLGIGWTGTYPGSLAKMGIDTLGYVSAPKSLSCETVSSMDASANDPNTEAKLVRLVLGKYKQLSADVDIRVDQASSDPNLTVELMGVSMIAQSGNPNWHVVLHHYSTKLQVVEEHFGYPDGGYDFLYNDVPQQFTIGQWTHVHIEVATTGTMDGM